jgi:hypothetical protein
MKKIIIFIIFFSFIEANKIFIIADRNLTKGDKKFLNTIKTEYFYTQRIKNGNISFYKKRKNEVLESLKKNKLQKYTIFRVINNLMENNDLNSNDILIIFSNMYFQIDISNKVYINTKTQVLNDGFITSEYSPFSILFNKNINKLKGVKIMIISNNNQPIFYIQKMRRFYFYFFQKLKANLYYYGNNIYKCKTGECSTNRLSFLFFYLQDNKNLFNYSSLESTDSLQVIDVKNKLINNIGVDLKIRDDIFYKE